MNQRPLVETPENNIQVRHRRNITSHSFDLSGTSSAPGIVPASTTRVVLGTALARLCPVKKPCQNSTCWAQPFCKCVRAEWTSTRKNEEKVWLAISLASLVVLLLALALAAY